MAWRSACVCVCALHSEHCVLGDVTLCGPPCPLVTAQTWGRGQSGSVPVASCSHFFFKDQLPASTTLSLLSQHYLPATPARLKCQGKRAGCWLPVSAEAGSHRLFLPFVTGLTFLCGSADPGVKGKVRQKGVDWGA